MKTIMSTARRPQQQSRVLGATNSSSNSSRAARPLRNALCPPTSSSSSSSFATRPGCCLQRCSRFTTAPVARMATMARFNNNSNNNRNAPPAQARLGTGLRTAASSSSYSSTAAVTLRPRRPARSAGGTRVVAFRDAHRAQQLLDTASEFVGYWMLGRQEGPTGRVMTGLRQMAAEDVTADVHGLLVHTRDVGPDGLARLLDSAHRPTGLTLKHWHSRVCAANEDTDTVFCLVEMRAEDEEGRPRSAYQVLKLDLLLDDGARRVTAVLERGQWDAVGDDLTPLLLAPMIEREVREEEVEGVVREEEEEAMADWEAEAKLEDQEAAAAAAAAAAEQPYPHLPRRHGGSRDRPMRTRSARAGGEVVGSDLPVERIVPQGLGAERLRDAARAWCAARSSGTDPRVILEPLLAPDFRLWDAYGLLPLVCSIGDRRAGQQAAAAAAAIAGGGGAVGAVGAAGSAAAGVEAAVSEPGGSAAVVSGAASSGGGPSGYTMALMMGGGGCVAPREAVYDIIESAKAEYDVQVTPVDLAVSYTHNVVFNHWHCVMTPKGPYAATDGGGRPLPIEQECVEVDIFDGEGRLTDAWMFRDALDFEKHMMMARRKSLAEEEAEGRQQQQAAARRQRRQEGKGGKRTGGGGGGGGGGGRA
ncbi:hypothetical protein PLESTM_001675600 [Pleodorina starrii]|nr:hypothetical protein PLESTM_001675600 [Pleodorina starrii]